MIRLNIIIAENQWIEGAIESIVKFSVLFFNIYSLSHSKPIEVNMKPDEAENAIHRSKRTDMNSPIFVICFYSHCDNHLKTQQKLCLLMMIETININPK